MLRTVKFWHHLVVAVSIAVMTALVGFGVFGAGDESLIRPEHFDAKQVTVWPVGDDGVRIREVVDIDFALNQRHGYQRIVPNDFGAPVDVVASSPDADDRVSVVPIGSDTRIRIGDPNVTESGRHRYVLEYTLPEAGVSSGVLALDIIGNDETFATERFEVVLTGFDFDGTQCDTGAYGSFGGCEFTRTADGNQVAVIEPLAPGAGITVGGEFTSVAEPRFPAVPPRLDKISFGFRPFGLVMVPLGALAAAVVYAALRSYGSNDVAGGGAADAAFGSLPLPGGGRVPGDVGTYRVPDGRLADLATIEFAPPRGVEPWQAAVLLREAVDDDTVAAWFSEMIAEEAIVVDDGDELTLRPGPNTARLNAVDQRHLRRLFASTDEVALGSYDPRFTGVWNTIEADQREFVRTSGWWSRGGPGTSVATPVGIVVTIIVLIAVVFTLLVFVSAAPGGAWSIVGSPWLAIALGIAVPFVVASIAYSGMAASRTATGSALALRSESFRRFLVASEGRHVEWAWEQGLLREYSAWAVALGAADAWSDAIESSNLADPGVALAGPLIMHSHRSTFQSTHVAPSSSGGGGGGGGVGGGGGGGSSGSW